MVSQWEDCSHRIQSLNILLRISEKFEKKLGVIKNLMAILTQQPAKGGRKKKKTLVSGEELSWKTPSMLQRKIIDKILDLLGTLEEDLQHNLPEAEYQNDLDIQMREIREKEFEEMIQGVVSLKTRLSAQDRPEKELKDIMSGGVDELDSYLSRIKYLAIEVGQNVKTSKQILTLLKLHTVYLATTVKHVLVATFIKRPPVFKDHLAMSHSSHDIAVDFTVANIFFIAQRESPPSPPSRNSRTSLAI